MHFLKYQTGAAIGELSRPDQLLAGARRAAPAILIGCLLPVVPAWASLPDTTIPLHYALALQPDARNLRFSGDEKIDILVRAPSDEIVLNAFQLDVAQVRLNGASGAGLGPVRVRLDARDQTMHLSVGTTIQPGRYRLSIAYSGRIQQNGSGFFALDAHGKRYLFTQLEATDARRLMPCWDEPAFKARFTLSTLVPPGSVAISNMPATGDRRRADGWHQVRFATTPKMASYVLFLAVGAFERATRKVQGVELGVVTRRGAAPQAQFALDSAAHILPWLNAYFAYPFPLAKLDDIAGPGESPTYGAMENWGAIFSFEHDFLIDPRAGSERQKRGVFTTLAHEMAHQWFGDLVTMRWWDDLWLNEGFAVWMEQEAQRRFHPEWSPELTFMRGRDLAMEADALDTSHPVVQPVADGASALQSFDFITYFKGEAAIRMLEAYVGPTAWRKGLRDYIARHAYGSATSADLWAAVSAASRRPVADIARDITRKPGLPLVEVSSACVQGRTVVRLAERRFHSDGRDDAGPGWRLPVALGHPGRKPRALLLEGNASVSIAGCGATLVNIGQKSYFRTSYAPAMLTELSRAFPDLDRIDQLALLSDTAALGYAGMGSPAATLQLIANLGRDAPDAVVSDALARWSRLYGYASGDARGRGLLRGFAETAFAPRLKQLGWTPRPNEAAEDAELRDALIETLGGAGVPSVLAQARRIFETGDTSFRNMAILAAVSRNATSAQWERILAMASAEKSPQIRSSLFELLGSADDSALADRALDLSLTDAPDVTTGPRMIEAVAARHPLKAFRFALAHREAILQRLDSFSAPTFVADLVGRGGDAETLAAVQSYCGQPQPHAIQDACASTSALIRDRVRIRADAMPQIYAWLGARAAAGGGSS